MKLVEASDYVRRPTLRVLPAALETVFPGRFPWSPISTTTVIAALCVDRGIWGTWRCRGLAPSPLPPDWFHRTAGRPVIYRVDVVRGWLAERRGEPYDALTDWCTILRTKFATVVSDPRRHAAMYGRAAGPVVGDVKFTPSGFTAYLDSLLAT